MDGKHAYEGMRSYAHSTREYIGKQTKRRVFTLFVVGFTKLL